MDLEAHGHSIHTAWNGKGAAQMVRIHRSEDGIWPPMECGVRHHLGGAALGGLAQPIGVAQTAASTEVVSADLINGGAL